MRPPLVPQTALLQGFVLLCMVAVLPGCATSEHWRSAGEITTKDRQPFYLSSANQKLLIAPGTLTITPVEDGLFNSPKLVIENAKGKLVIDLHQGELTPAGIRIVGVTHGLSANILGTWQDLHQGLHDGFTTESCSTYGYCAKEKEEKICDDKGNCRKEKFWEHGHYSDCPGSRAVSIHYEDYTRAYRIAFLNPRNTTEELANYQGVTGMLSREIGRDAGPCELDYSGHGQHHRRR
ncbi:hypothetical protein [uncultured Thiodictyon sp.]|jgi:hypothetical protein|uniref:hypothetical protein n=1 Tax=uncultured Thiodictyon sp. TaxID=1846217 RepID=UPI0025F25652|nr:hypothetical protein [uncultured Thiodictyon sp.]